MKLRKNEKDEIKNRKLLNIILLFLNIKRINLLRFSNINNNFRRN